MKILITGASGFLGRNLCKAFIDRGDNVIGLSRDPKILSGIIPGITTFPYSIAGAERSISDGFIDCTIHTATSYGRDGETFSEMMEANVHLPLKIARTIGKRSRQFINIGTALPRQLNEYTKSKHHFTDLFQELKAEIPNRIHVSLQNAYGIGDNSHRFTSYVIKKCLHGEPLELTNCFHSRDFIYISDIISAIMMLSDLKSRSSWTEYQLGSGQSVTLRHFVSLVHKASNSTSSLGFGSLPLRHGEPDVCRADISNLVNIGWKPLVTLEEGIQKLIRHENQLKKSA